jgi:carbamoyltransferase
MDYKRRAMPGMSPRVYRLAAQGFDSAAALVTEAGTVAAAAEERFVGEKATGAFPINAIRFCLSQGGLELADVDLLAHGFHYRSSPVHQQDDYLRRRFELVYAPTAQIRWLQRFLPGIEWASRFVPVPHHLAHAASAFYPSGRPEALVIVADGMGEDDSLTVALGEGDDITILRTVPALHSLGTLYGVFTHYLGFQMSMDEHKVMGLAAFGDPRRFYSRVCSMVELRTGGEFAVPLLARNHTIQQQETHAGVLETLAETFGVARKPGEPVDQRHRDVAAALQAVLESTFMHVVSHFRAETGQRNLCLAGGVALNCALNGKLHRSRLFDRVFVQPAAGDDGTALGAALYVNRREAHDAAAAEGPMPYLGPSYGDDDFEEALRLHRGNGVRRFGDFEELAREVARLLAAGRVIAWFQDRMEFGPRALGNRSILADPRDAAMRDHVNEVVKEREAFQPFAPVVTAEDASRWFAITPGEEEVFAHMLFTASVRPSRRHRLAAVTHVDGSARVQVVARDQNSKLWHLLREFQTLTDVPVLLNTSFNLKGQPIVRTPADAVATFFRSRLDYLVMGTRLVSR